MREKIIIFVILLSNYSLSQDVYVPSEGCPINTISTHPESYQNSSDPDNSQLWDWRTETFNVYYKEPGMGDLGFPASIRSPYFELISNSNILHFTDAVEKDFKNKDGWELLYRNFGSESKGVDNPYYVLYNRFSGILRVFVNIKNSGTQNSNAATITLAFKGTSMKTALLNQLGLSTKAVDNFESEAIAANNNSYVNSGVNDNFYWLSADFNTLYDPCTCGLESDIMIIVALISDTKVDLSINGEVTTLLDNTGSNQTISNQSPFTSLSQYFDFGSNLISDAQGLFSSANQAYETGVQLQDAADQFITNNSGLFGDEPASDIARQVEKILYEVPTIGQWLKFGSTLISTVKKTEENLNSLSVQEKKKLINNTKITTKNVDLKLTGGLSQSAKYLEAFLALPGSKNLDLPEFRRPIYNNVLGVFNLAENPKVNLTKYSPPNDLIVPFGEMLILNSEMNIFPDLYKAEISEPLKPILNPASGLKIESLEARIEYLNREGPDRSLKGPMELGELKYFEDTDFLNGFNGDRKDYYKDFGTNFLLLNKDNFNSTFYKWDKSLFASNFVPQGCFSKLRLFSWSPMEDIVVKVNVILVPEILGNNTDVDKILVSYTYPVNVEDFNSPLNYEVTGAVNNTVLRKEYNNQILGISIPGVIENNVVEYPSSLSLSNQLLTQDVFVRNYIIIGSNVEVEEDVVVESMGSIFIEDTPLTNGNKITFRARDSVVVVPELELNPDIILEIDNNIHLPCALSIPSTVSNTEIAEYCNSDNYLRLSRPSKLKEQSSRDIFAFNIYPNPTSGNVTATISLDQEVNGHLFITDMNGRVLNTAFRDKILREGESRHQLSTESLAKGIYLVHLIVDGERHVKRLVKQ